jgi:MFS transporter, DHA1 family, staphyloferrin A biosynthesis exporter
VLGSIYVAQLPEQPARLRLMTLTLVGLALFFAAFALSPWFLLAILLALAANACATAFTAVNNVSIQMLVPDEVRGRVSSFMLMSFSVTPLGTLPMAWVAEHYGAPVAVAGASGLMLVVVAVFVLLSRTLRQLDSRLEEVLNHQK